MKPDELPKFRLNTRYPHRRSEGTSRRRNKGTQYLEQRLKEYQMSEYVNVRISREAYDAIKDGITQAACDIYNKIGIWPSNPEILHVSEHINRIVINHAHNWKELFDAMRETNAEYEDVPKELLDTIM